MFIQGILHSDKKQKNNLFHVLNFITANNYYSVNAMENIS